jgi:O-antigen ligase
LALAYLAVLVVVMLAGARAGWVSLIVVSVMLGWRIARGSWARMAGLTAAAVLVTALIGGSAYHQSETFKARMDRTLLLKKGTIDVALAGRIWIWQTANAMAQAHPINGVGVRGFRYAYPNFSYPIDPWINPQTHTGAAHAHQIFLELLTETGVIGLSLWFIAAATLWALARRSGRNRYTRAPWVALMVMMFPINTHLAFYSSFMGVVIAWLIALACAQSLLMPAARQTGPGNAA